MYYLNKTYPPCRQHNGFMGTHELWDTHIVTCYWHSGIY